MQYVDDCSETLSDGVAAVTITYILDGTEESGLMDFQINVKNKTGGEKSVTTETTNDGSTVTIVSK